MIRRIVGRVGNGVPTGHARTASSVSSRIASKNARIRSPFKRRHDNAALPGVLRPVEHQDRVPADGRDEDRVGLARVEHVRIGTEDLADDLRVGHHHEPAIAGDVQREDVAVAVPALVEQPERVAREPKELPPGRGGRPRWECGGRRRDRWRHARVLVGPWSRHNRNGAQDSRTSPPMRRGGSQGAGDDTRHAPRWVAKPGKAS